MYFIGEDKDYTRSTRRRKNYLWAEFCHPKLVSYHSHFLIRRHHHQKLEIEKKTFNMTVIEKKG